MNASTKIEEFLPHSIEAEQALLGAVLLQNDVYLLTCEAIEPEMFFESLHGKLWEMLGERITQGQSVNAITLGIALGPDAAMGYGGITVSKYLARLVTEAVSTIGAPDYARTIRELWQRRRIIALARDVIERAVGGFDAPEVDALLDETDQQLCSIRFGKQINGVASIGELADKALLQTSQAYQSTAKIGFDTGIAAIDELMGPIMPGDMLTLLGPSGGGKSALAAQILAHNCEPSIDANRGVPVLFISQEMGGAQVARRSLSTHTGISTRMQRTGEIVSAEYGYLRDAAERLKHLPFYVDESGRQSTSRIIRKLRAMKKRYGIRMAVIDHLLLIRPENQKMSKFDTIEFAAMEIKDVAKELDIAVILLAQLTRESQKREFWRIRDMDLFGGDQVKQCSDIMMTVTLPEKWLRQREPDQGDKLRAKWEGDCLRWEGKAEIGFPKLREGEDGRSCSVSFDGPRMLFKD